MSQQQFKKSPGLYYDHVREAHLYNNERKVVTYINLETADDNLIIQIMRHAHGPLQKSMNIILG